MAEYIERDKIVKWLRRVARLLKATENHKGKTKLIGQIIDHINKTSLAEVVEVFHGEWLICADGYYPYCSRCGKEPKNGELTNYYPDCGARMDGADVQNT